MAQSVLSALTLSNINRFSKFYVLTMLARVIA